MENNEPWVKMRVPGQVGFHVVPTKDTQEHALNVFCLCHPEVEDERGPDAILINRVIVHRAWDGRPGPLEETEL